MSEHLRTYFVDLKNVRAEPTQWVVEDILPVGLTFVGGPPKSFKSTVTGALAAMVSGHLCEALPTGYRAVKTPGPVAWWSIEAPASALKSMLTKDLGVKFEGLSGINVCTDPWAWQLDDDDGVAKLMEYLDETEPALVIMDPFRDLHSSDENDSRAMVQILRPLAEWATKNSAAFVMVHHVSKPQEGQLRYTAMNMRGSSAIFGKADGVLTMSPDPKLKGRITIDAVFKRAAAWTRQFQLGAFTWPKPGMEIMDTACTQALGHVVRGVSGDQLTLALGAVDIESTHEILGPLVRNGLIEKKIIKNRTRFQVTPAGVKFLRQQQLNQEKWRPR